MYARKVGRPDFIIAVYVTFVLLAQVLATKVVEFDIGFVAPAGVIIFPFTFQITDIINERFGQRETHKAILIAFLTQFIMVFFLLLATSMDGFIPASTSEDATSVWNSVFGFTLGITTASWISFLVSENLDAHIFQLLKKATQDRYLWLRNVGSDVVSITLDSFLFVPLAFVVFPTVLGQEVSPGDVVVTLVVGQTVTKLMFGILDTPFLYITRWLMLDKVALLNNWFGPPKETNINE